MRPLFSLRPLFSCSAYDYLQISCLHDENDVRFSSVNRLFYNVFGHAVAKNMNTVCLGLPVRRYLFNAR